MFAVASAYKWRKNGNTSENWKTKEVKWKFKVKMGHRQKCVAFVLEKNKLCRPGTEHFGGNLVKTLSKLYLS